MAEKKPYLKVTCRPLVALGYMEEFRASELTGGSPLFRVSEAGKAAVRSESPKPPKLSRSQRQYESPDFRPVRVRVTVEVVR
jgi:hypothetical protein